MRLLKTWEREATCPHAFRRGWRGGKLRVFKCEDQFGNIVVWCETEYEGIGVQAASVVFGRDEEGEADLACAQVFETERPFFISSTKGRQVQVHDHLLGDK